MTGLKRASLVAACILCATQALAQQVWDPEVGMVDMSAPVTHTARGEYIYARGLMVRGDFAAAAERFAMIEAQYPESPLADRSRLCRARCLARVGRVPEAIALADSLRKPEQNAVTPQEIFEFERDALRQFAEAQPESAASLLKAAADAVPTPGLRHDLRLSEGDAWLRQRNYEAARIAYEAALADAPNTSSRERLHFKAALADLCYCRDRGVTAERVDRAGGHLDLLPRTDLPDSVALLSLAVRECLATSNPAQQQVYTALSYFPEERYADAGLFFSRQERRFRNTAAGELAGYYAAEAAFRGGDAWGAFKKYEDFVERYPGTQRMAAVIAAEIEIGGKLSEAGQRRHAIDAWEAAVIHNPSSSVADDALMEIGRAYMGLRDYASARVAFEQVTQQHGQSEWAAAAIFETGVADLKSTEFSNDNEALLSRARQSFEMYLAQAPTGPFAERCQALLRQVDEMQAAEIWRTVEFYQKRGQSRAAAMTARTLIVEHPESSLAKGAQQIVADFEKKGATLP